MPCEKGPGKLIGVGWPWRWAPLQQAGPTALLPLRGGGSQWEGPGVTSWAIFSGLLLSDKCCAPRWERAQSGIEWRREKRRWQRSCPAGEGKEAPAATAGPVSAPDASRARAAIPENLTLRERASAPLLQSRVGSLLSPHSRSAKAELARASFPLERPSALPPGPTLQLFSSRSRSCRAWESLLFSHQPPLRSCEQEAGRSTCDNFFFAFLAGT